MKQRIKKVSKVTTTLIIVFSILLVTLLSLTMAYFTDSKSYTGTLNFGNVKLKVTDKNNTEMNDGDTIVFDITRTGEVTQKLMPGDTIGINFSVSLQGGDNPSEPAYYLVSISDTEGVLDEATYYHDGTNVVKNTDSAKSVGELTVGQTHAFNISKQVPTDETRRGVKTTVSVKVYAVQKANLEKYNATDTSKSAYHILTKNMEPKKVLLPKNADVKSVITNWEKLTSIGFYYTKNVPSGYSLNADLTSGLDAKLDADSKGLLKIYKKSDTEIAFASNDKILPPKTTLVSNDCQFMFYKCSSLSTIVFNNFDTSNVYNFMAMFEGCSSLDNIDLSGFDTSKVTDMSRMFSGCSSLKNLNMDGFITDNVTEMGSMFYNCSSLTSLDISSWNRSKVKGMGRMFSGCSGLTSLIVNGGNVNLTSRSSSGASGMFEGCSSLTYLDISNFWISGGSVSDMFKGTFSNNPSGSKLKMSSNSIIVGQNQLTTNSQLKQYTGLDTQVQLEVGSVSGA